VFVTVPEKCPGAKLAILLRLALPQVNGHVVSGISSFSPAFYAFVLGVLVIVLVVAPAVWSRRPARRKAAAAVLDLLLRFLRSRPP
jgi:hypothetical protein